MIRNKQRVNYIYNVSKYITWSNIEENTTFTVGVYGSDVEALISEFEKVSSKKNIKNLPVEVVNVKSVETIKGIQILYIHKNSEVELNNVLPRLALSEVLLVSENYPFRESMINFMEFRNELHLDVNDKHINDAGLLVSPQLLTFSIQQQKDWEEIFAQLEEERNIIEVQTNEVEELNKEIDLQKVRLEAQRDQIRTQQRKLVNQEGNIREKQGELAQKLREINFQRHELSELQKLIKRQSVETDRLTNTLDQQADSIRVRKLELLRQMLTMSEQEESIRMQEQKISKQDAKINIQLERMRSQGLLIYVFMGIIALILGLIFYAGRQYRRKERSEEEVRVQNKKLLALNESLDSFVYRVSHDLKAPVINVKNMITMLKEHTNEEEESLVPKIIDNLELSSNRLDVTITDLLELSRIEKVDEIRDEIQIEEVFLSILPEYQDELSEIEGKVEMIFNDGGTYSSFSEMASVLQNLLTNSIKYRRKDVPLVVEIYTNERNGRTVIDYRDNGQGIDLKQFEGKLFSMFQRFTSDKSISGTGVGMYIIKRLIDKNNGTVKLEGELNKGLRYLITLPKKTT